MNGLAEEEPLPHFRFVLASALMVSVVMGLVACSSKIADFPAATPGVPDAVELQRQDSIASPLAATPSAPVSPEPDLPPPVVASPVTSLTEVAPTLLPRPTPSSDSGTSIATERAALVALYNAAGGPEWTNSENWLSDRPLGEWYGVTTKGRVTELHLPDNNLAGTLPPEVV